MTSFFSCFKSPKKNTDPIGYRVDSIIISKHTKVSDLDKRDFAKISKLHITSLPSDKVLQSLFEKLSKNKLTELTVIGVKLDNKNNDLFFTSLKKLLTENSNFTKVHLQNCDLTLARFESLMPPLQNQSYLEKLDVSENEVTDLLIADKEKPDTRAGKIYSSLLTSTFSNSFELITEDTNFNHAFNDTRKQHVSSNNNGLKK